MEGTPKTVTLSKEADGWDACISCATVPVQPLPLTGQETGIDVGVKSFLALADGTFIENPRYYRTAEKALKRAQRRETRRKQGSHRRRKAVRLLASKQQKIARQRRDFHHQTALALVRQYDTFYHEALQSKSLSARPKPKAGGNGAYLPNGASRKAGLNKSINDAGWSQFLTILSCKAAYAGKGAEAVPPAYTTQECSGYGERVPKSLSVRTHVCPACGLVVDRDTNAALNILRAGQARQGAVAVAAALN